MALTNRPLDVRKMTSNPRSRRLGGAMVTASVGSDDTDNLATPQSQMLDEVNKLQKVVDSGLA